MPEAELIALLSQLGFQNPQVTHRFDAFAGTSKASITAKFQVMGVNISALKP